MAPRAYLTGDRLLKVFYRFWPAARADAAHGDVLVFSEDEGGYIPIAGAGGTGLPGPKGDKGDTGVAGPAGQEGPAGPVGPQGAKGDVGSAGAAGAAGAQGPEGPAGPQGDQGAAGAQGPAGPKGTTGDVGPAGAAGAQGAAGPQGSAGAQGPQGVAGPAGQDGAPGAAGAAGAQGPAGPAGSQGPAGDAGPAGAQGPKGDTGDTGPQGLQGPAGPQGLPGATGPAGPAAAWGAISGTLSAQTDLSSALAGKADTSHSHAEADITGLTAALAAKAPLASPAFTGTPTGITKAHVGLGNVDNTSDAAKPISSAAATVLNAILGVYRTILQAAGSHTAARAAGTYAFGQGDPLAVSGTGTLYPLALIRIDSADYPTINSLAPKFRVKWVLEVNDVAPTGNFTFGLHPVTRPGTSGGAGLGIYTIGAAVTGSTSAANAPAADAQLTGASADFALPADGWYVLGVVTTAAVATSSHLHMAASLQVRNA